MDYERMSERKHNYAPTVAALLDRHRGYLLPGTVHEIVVEHYDWCLIWTTGPCSCNPTMTLIDRTDSAVDNRRNKR